MGKGNAQRTKGNAQSSSSARAAELVQQNGGFSFQTFSALGGAGRGLGYVGAAAASGAGDAELDPTLGMLLNKLRKRDAVTKLKTLRELEQELSKAEDEAITQVLPHWPRLYNRLCTDGDRRVREHTQKVWHFLATRAKKRLAPVLKSVMGNWLCSMYDPHRDVARIATEAFEGVFTEEKRDKTLLFCRDDVLGLLRSNLLEVGVDTLRSANTGEDDVQLASRVDRIQSTSLLCFSRMLKLSLDEEAQTIVSEVLTSSKFWKLAKSDNGNVTSALMNVVATATKSCSSLLEPNMKKAATATISLASHLHASTMYSAWEALMHFVVHLNESFFAAVNARKALLPAIFKTLRAAGGSYPDAPLQSFPLLLGHLPQELVGDGVSLMQECLGALSEGGRHPNARRVGKQLVQCYFDTALYFVRLAADASGETALLQATAACVGQGVTGYLGGGMFEGVPESDFSEQTIRFVFGSAHVLNGAQLTTVVQSWEAALATGLEVPATTSTAPSAPSLVTRDKLLNVLPSFLAAVCKAPVVDDLARTSGEEGAGPPTSAARAKQQTLSTLQAWAGRVTQHLLINLETLGSGAPSPLPRRESENAFDAESPGPAVAAPQNAFSDAVAAGGLAVLTRLLAQGTDVSVVMQPGQDPAQFLRQQLLPALEALAPGRTDLEEVRHDHPACAAVKACGTVVLKSSLTKAEQTELLTHVWAQCQRSVQLRIVFLATMEQFSAGDIVSELRSLGTFSEFIADTRALLQAGQASAPPISEEERPMRLMQAELAGQMVLYAVRGQQLPPLSERDDEAEEMLHQCRLLFESAAVTLAPVEDVHCQELSDSIRDAELVRGVAKSVAVVLPTLLHPSWQADTRLSAAVVCVCPLLEAAVPLVTAACQRGDALPSDLGPAARRALIEAGKVLRDTSWLPILSKGLMTYAASMQRRAIFSTSESLVQKYEALGEADVDRYKLITEVSAPSAAPEDEIALAIACLGGARQRLPQCTDDLEAFAAGELLEVDSVEELEGAGAVSPASVVEGAALACYMLSCRLPVTPCGYSASFVQRLLMMQAHCSLLSSKGTSTTLRLAGAIAQAAADQTRTWLTHCVSSEQGSSLLRQLTQDMLSSSSSNIQEPWRGPLVVASRHLLLVLLEDIELSGAALHAVLNAPWETEQDISLDSVHAVQTVLATVPLHTAGDQDLVRRKASEALSIAESGESMAEVYPDEVASLLRPFSVAVSCILAVLNAEELHRAMDVSEDREAGAGSAAPAAQRALERARKTQELLGTCNEGTWTLLRRALTLLQVWKEDNDDVLDVDEDTHEEMPEEQLRQHLALCGEAAKVFSACVNFTASKLTSEEWDFLLCTALAWLQLRPATPHCRMLLGQAVALWNTLGGRMARLLAAIEAGGGSVPEHLVAVARDWKSFFANDGQRQLAPLLVHALENWATSCQADNREPPTTLALLRHLVRAGPSLSSLAPQLPLTVLPLLVKGLFAASAEIRHGIFHVLRLFLSHYAKPASHRGEIAADDEDMDTEVGEDGVVIVVDKNAEGTFGAPEGDLSKEWYAPLLEAVGCQPSALAHRSLPAQHLDSLEWQHGFYYAWELMSELVTALPQESRPPLTTRIEKSGAVRELLTHLFDFYLADKRLLRDELVQQLRHPSATLANGLPCTEAGLRVSAACVYACMVRRMAALVRHFWQSECPRRLKQPLADFTETYVSPSVIESELQAAHNTVLESETSTMIVKARFVTGELVAEYTIDERQMELVIAPAPNHPLRNIEIRSGRQRVGVSASTWRTWTLQLITFVANQNGTLLEAVKIWKRNIDKRFEGVEECTVCYSVIHGSNFQVPNTKCRTCRKKFHSDCLYKWFNSSNQATCPLCRSLF